MRVRGERKWESRLGLSEFNSLTDGFNYEGSEFELKGLVMRSQLGADFGDGVGVVL